MTVVPKQHEFRQMLEHFPQMICWKDTGNEQLIGCNQKFADFVGLNCSEDIIGLTGYDFFEPELVELLRNYESKAIEQKRTVEINDEVYYKKTGFTAIDVTIAPILNEKGEVASVIYYGTPIIMLSDKPWKQAIDLINQDNMFKLLRNPKYFVRLGDKQVKLTKREAECALYLLKGLTSKEIAREMDLVPRTVDNYIESIKTKLDCLSRSELAASLMNGNFIDNF